MGTQLPSVAVLGTGAIGSALARNLAGAEFDVRAWNRSPERAAPLAADGVRVADSIDEAVATADVVLTSLYDAAAVREVFGLAAPHLRPGTVWAEMSTLGIADVEPLADLAREHGVVYVDAPVQGARPLAEQGQLLIYAAGPPDARPVLEPVFAAVGRRTDWLDDAHGSTVAAATKLVVNNWVFTLTTGSAEAVALAQRLGIDPENFLRAIADGPLDNAWAKTKAQAIIDGDFTALFPVRSARKDAELIRAAARTAGARLDVADAVRTRFERAEKQGHGDEDMVATYHASFDGEPA